ncbi:MAG: MFS transporter [Thermoplasmata archaeon]|nr:MFS transporter [Thermoplasmata archaeon]
MTGPSESAPATPHNASTRRPVAAILLVLASAALLVSYVETMLVPALPRLVTFFDGVPYTTVAWVISLYLLVGVCTLPLVTKLGDLVGKKRVLLTILAIYSIAVALAPFTPQLGAALGLSRASAIYLLIGVRGLQGVGLAMFPLALAMIGEELPPERVGPAQGIVAAMFAVGASAGLFGGAWLIQNFGWQVAYETVIPIAVLVTLLAVRALPESRHLLAARLDVPGAGLLGASLATFLLGLTLGPSWGWTQWTGAFGGSIPLGTPELLLLAGLLAVCFVLWERRTVDPMLDLKRFAERNIGLSYLAALLVGTALFTAFVGLTVLVELPVVGLGLSIFQFGELSLPTTFAMLIAAPLVGRGVSRFGPRPMVLLGSAVSVTGFLLLLVNHGTYLGIVLEAMPTFAGLVAILVSITNVIILSARKGETGIHTGMTEMFQDLGSSIGPVLVSALLATLTTTRSFVVNTARGPIVTAAVFPSATAFTWIFAAGLAMALACGAIGLLLRNYRFPVGVEEPHAAPGSAVTVPGTDPAV